MSALTIRAERLSKRYRLGQSGYLTLRETLASAVRRGDRTDAAELWALRDVTFDVAEGEALGIVGLNGAGKSTLLKILARITQPTMGVARTRGRVGALLEVGTGFHPELTGRENVFLSGAILGMRRREIARRFDEIIDFAGIEPFLDTPLKRYSSGMYLRLAFAVAAHLEPDIVIVDEVLAVGDVQFREKCIGKMSEFGNEGRTVVFVSHDSGLIGQLCSRALWIEEGGLRADGRADIVLDDYIRSNVRHALTAEFAPDPARRVQLLSLAITDRDGRPLPAPRRDEAFCIRLRFVATQRLRDLDVAVSLQTRHGVALIDEVWSDSGGSIMVDEAGEYDAYLLVPPMLASGEYFVGAWLGTGSESFYLNREVLSFQLVPGASDRAQAIDRSRLLQLRSAWRLERRQK